MPKSTNNRMGLHWLECSICGFMYPKTVMKRQRGEWVCTVVPCYDEPNRQYYEDQLEMPETESEPVFIPDDPFPETSP